MNGSFEEARTDRNNEFKKKLQNTILEYYHKNHIFWVYQNILGNPKFR